MDGNQLTTEIIAEIGQNHNGDMSVAAELIKAGQARRRGRRQIPGLRRASAVPAEDREPLVRLQLLRRSSRETTCSRLADVCDKVGIEFMASVFDIERIDWLEAVGVRRYKIASRSINDNGADRGDRGNRQADHRVAWLVEAAAVPTHRGVADVDFLYCVAKYPAPLDELRSRHRRFPPLRRLQRPLDGHHRRVFILRAGGAHSRETHDIGQERVRPGSRVQHDARKSSLLIHAFRSEWEQSR